MRYIRFVFSGVIIALFMFMTTTTFAQEVINIGDTVEGTITNTDVEYAINLEAGQLVIMAITSVNADLYISVIDSQSIEIAYDYGDSTDLPYSAFIVPATGTYKIRLGSYSVNTRFTLSVRLGDINSIEVNSPLDIQYNGTPQFFSFTAAAGDVVTILASNPNYLSIDMELFGPDGSSVAKNSDIFYYNQLRRIILPLSGVYFLKLSSFSVSDVAETVTLSVSTDELLTLDNGSVTVTIVAGDVDFDVVRFTARAGTTYVLNVAVDNPEKGANIDFVLGVDEFGFGIRAEARIRNISAASFEFVPSVDNVISFIVSEESFFSFGDTPTNITLSVTAK